MVTVLLVVLGSVIALVAVVWGGSRMLRNPGNVSSGSNAFGGFDVFDPARERGKEDLESQKRQGTVAPIPEDDDRPVRVDITRGTAHVRKPRT